ncbi:MAG TPA: tetratricopeptide repeat protein [Flavobacterium sp.]|jgi:tetratricopeptide (TPR) repeat protein
MKKFIVIAAAVLFNFTASAQKDEMKVLKRIYDKEKLNDKDIAEYKTAVSALEPYIASASEADRVYMNYLKVQVPSLELNAQLEKPENQNQSKMLMLFMKTYNIKNIPPIAEAYNAVLNHEKQTGKKVYTKDIEEEYTTVAPMLQQYAVTLANQNNYKDAARILYSMYLMSPSNQDMLYNAANFALNAKDYDLALQYYNELKNLNYSGEGTAYIAKNRATDQEDVYPTKEQRDRMVTLGTHSLPREEKIPSKRGEIYKNIALILVNKGKVEEAKAALAEAKKQNPDDTSLLLTEADMYLTLKDTETYKKLISQVLEKNPNDADLVYNLGVISMQSNQDADAEKYFARTIEINPDYINAYINLSALKLKGDKKIVDEMNKLGTTEKDNKRYAVLKKEREALFKGALPYLEKAYAIDAKNDSVIDNLIGVYGFLEMTDKQKAVKAARSN